MEVSSTEVSWESAISIQKIVRGVIARGTCLESLQPRLDAVRHFHNVWKKTIEQVPCSVPSLTGWSLVRERLDLKRVDLLDEDGNLADTDEKLNQALSVALTEEDESENYNLGFSDSGDELYDKAVSIVCREKRASTSFVQRHLQIGYNRAARIIDMMEADGIVSKANHVGKREVL